MFLQDYIAEALRIRLKYLRNYQGKSKKAKVEGQDHQKPPKIPKIIKPNPPIYLSLDDWHEDDTTRKRSITILQQTCKQKDPSMHIISEFMAKTFKSRRSQVIENPCPVSVLLKDYPGLKYYSQVIFKNLAFASSSLLIMSQDMCMCVCVRAYKSDKLYCVTND